jgi:AcrR family transcriptional regulator
MTADAPAGRHRPKDRKQQILVHARDLFLELGYPSVSMAMIADRVGITAGALYRHYATKAELLEAVVRDAFSGAVQPAGGLSLEELMPAHLRRRRGGGVLAGLRAPPRPRRNRGHPRPGDDHRYPEQLERDMRKVVGYDMTADAAQRVYEASGVGPQDIPVVELHDCFTTNELLSYEALGLTPAGTAEKFVRDGDNTYGGRVVTNPSGGLLSKGHPLGATGLAQCAELVWQLRGQAGPRQVEGAGVALQRNLGLGHRGAPDQAPAAGADDDPDAGRPPGGDRPGRPRRLDAHRGRRLHGRARLRLRGRPHQGHDHLRRRERVLDRGGERRRPAPGRRPGGGDRGAR